MIKTLIKYILIAKKETGELFENNDVSFYIGSESGKVFKLDFNLKKNNNE